MVREDLSEKVTLRGTEDGEKQSNSDTQRKYTPGRARVFLAYSRTSKKVGVARVEGWKEKVIENELVR